MLNTCHMSRMKKIQVLSCSYDITSIRVSGTDGVPPYVPPNETVTFTVARGPNCCDADEGVVLNDCTSGSLYVEYREYVCVYIYIYIQHLLVLKSWTTTFFCLDRNKVICNLLMFYGPHRSLVLCFFTDGMTSMFDFRSRAEKHKTTCHCKMLALDLINW